MTNRLAGAIGLIAFGVMLAAGVIS